MQDQKSGLNGYGTLDLLDIFFVVLAKLEGLLGVAKKRQTKTSSSPDRIV